MTTAIRVDVRREELPAAAVERVLTPDALDFLTALHDEFAQRRLELLARRHARQAAIRGGERPQFARGGPARESGWSVATAPADLNDRRVEITGPCERKMMINALNSGASVFMADLEDALSPSGRNIVEGQSNLMDAVRRDLTFTNPDGKGYELNDALATLLVRPRGWHLPESHLVLDGEPMSGSLVDFGLYFFHNAAEALRRRTGPYFYLPKLESHLEARLWNDVFVFAQDALGIPRGTIRATVLIETILAAFEMPEILYELREHASGLNAGRWDYIFSVIKKFHDDPAFVLPDRASVTMGTPFMSSYAQLLVQSCHRVGAHAIGGMAAFIPNRRDEEVTTLALAKVREDKEREARQGFDGTWVAHPDLVPVAKAVFDRVLGDRPNQKEVLREHLSVSEADLLNVSIANSAITLDGVRTNVRVGMQYLAAWLGGSGAVAIDNLMEDAATAEISRAQLWQWIHRGAAMKDGGKVTADLYRRVREEELAKLRASAAGAGEAGGRLDEAARLMDDLVLQPEFTEFLTLPGYERLA